MLEVTVTNTEQTLVVERDLKTLKFGRKSDAANPAMICLIDEFVSRNQFEVSEIGRQQISLRNMSGKVPVYVDRPVTQTLAPDRGTQSFPFDLPVRLTVGKTVIALDSPGRSRDGGLESIDVDTSALMTISKPLTTKQGGSAGFSLDATPDAERLISWFEMLVSVQQAAAGSGEFYLQTAQAVVEMVGLDYGIVLLLKNGNWDVAAKYPPDAPGTFSQTLIDQVAELRRTLYQGSDTELATASLVDMSAWVASPILDVRDERVIGVVYGAREFRPMEGPIGVSSIEAKLVQVLAATVASGLARQEKEAEAIRAHVQFEQFVSPEVVRELDRDPDLLKGRDREVSILFADIRNFSRMSERFGAQVVFELLVSVMDRLGERIRQFQGTMVDYLGDGLFAMWNAPVSQPDHADLACRAAVAIIEDLPLINREWESTIGDPLVLGIGINSGMAMVGNNGSRARFHYGPMGHTVNLASRVEGATKQLGVHVLVTGSTRAQIGDRFETRRICKAKPAGMDEPVDLYELQPDSVSEEWKTHRDAYEWALDLYEQKKWAEACAALVELLAEYKLDIDGPTVALVGRTVECLKSQPANFDSVWSLPSK